MLEPDEARYLSQEDLPESEVKVTVTVCFSKTITVKVNDYQIIDEGVDEDGCYYRQEDYSYCDLNTPAKVICGNDIKHMEDNGWDIDEFEATLDK